MGPEMSRLNRKLSIAAAAGIIALALFSIHATPAFAQACCGASQSTSLGRLAMGQRYLVGVDFQYRNYYGQFDGSTYRSLNGDMLDLRETIFGTIRIGRDFQLGLYLPFQQNYRDYGTLDEWGTGPGDASMNLRYELVQTGLYRRIPGIGFNLSAKLPTGRSVFDSMDRQSAMLQTDVTGTGAYEIGGGVEFEWTKNHWFFQIATGAQFALPFTSPQDRRISRGPLWNGALSAGYSFDAPFMANDALFLSLATAIEHTSGLYQDGVSMVDGSERLTRTTLQLGGDITYNLFMGLRVGMDIPIDGLGENLLASTNIGLVLRRFSL